MLFGAATRCLPFVSRAIDGLGKSRQRSSSGLEELLEIVRVALVDEHGRVPTTRPAFSGRQEPIDVSSESAVKIGGAMLRGSVRVGCKGMLTTKLCQSLGCRDVWDRRCRPPQIQPREYRLHPSLSVQS